MKKFSIFMFAALAMGGVFTSCEDAPAVAPMQENPQGPVLTVDSLKVQAAPILTSGTLELDKYVETPLVTLFTVAENRLPKGMSILPSVEISDNEAFANPVALPLTVDGNNFQADFNLWHEAHIGFFGDTEKTEQTVYYRLLTDVATPSGAVYHFGTPETYLATGSVKEIPMVSLMPDGVFYYTPGASNGWDPANSQYLYQKGDGTLFCGSIIVGNDGFKFTNVPAWDGEIYGAAAEAGVLTSPGDNLKPADGAGLYWVTADFTALSYSMTKVTAIGVIGAGGNWADDQLLTPNADGSEWTGTVALSGEWKIRFNHDWAANYGGKLSSPTLDGSNITGYDGTYTMTMTFAGHHPVIKLVKK